MTDSRPALSTKRALKRMLRGQFRRRYDRQAVWEQKWHDWMEEGSSPLWQTETLPTEIEQAMESGWLPPNATVIDIGCGGGELPLLLAQRGHDAVGIDFAPSAIDHARERQAREGLDVKLSYEVVDICGDVSSLGRFDALIDRGCFYGLQESQHASYADNVATMCESGAPFLMMCPLRDAPMDQRVESIRRALGDRFSIERFEESSIGSGGSGRSVRAVTLWMRRL